MLLDAGWKLILNVNEERVDVCATILGMNYQNFCFSAAVAITTFKFTSFFFVEIYTHTHTHTRRP